jgi:hypothetical protein
VFFRLFVGRCRCGEGALENARENSDHDDLGGSGQPKDLAELLGEYLLLSGISKSGLYGPLQT